MQADVGRQKRLAATRRTEHCPYAMSRNDALDHPQTIQHRTLCGVSGFPLEAIAIVGMPITVRLAPSVRRLAHSREVAPTICGDSDSISSEITVHDDIP